MIVLGMEGFEFIPCEIWDTERITARYHTISVAWKNQILVLLGKQLLSIALTFQNSKILTWTCICEL